MRINIVIFIIQSVVWLQTYEGYGARRDRLLQAGLTWFKLESTLFSRVRQNIRLFWGLSSNLQPWFKVWLCCFLPWVYKICLWGIIFCTGNSSVRRILKRGGQKLQKIWEEHRSEFEIVTLKFRSNFRPKSGEEQKKKIFTQISSQFSPKIKWRAKKKEKKRFSLKFCPNFCPKSGEEQKKRSSLKFRPNFRPKSDEEQKNKTKKRSFVPIFAQYQVISSPKPDAQLARGGHASVLLTFLCKSWQPKGGPWPNCPPPKYAPDW